MRYKSLDVLKGILIIFVVLGHSGDGIVHDVIFLFHMPLFFIISGCLLKREKIEKQLYLRNKALNLMIPYVCYLLLDTLFVQKTFTIKGIATLIWGGRKLSGTYWYITCFLFTLFLFMLIIRYCCEKVGKIILVLGGVIAIIESHFSEYIPLLCSPGIPWNLDISLLALIYIGIGFYYKEKILLYLNSDNQKSDFFALLVLGISTLFCIVNYVGRDEPFYYFDMKQLYYKELFSVVVIPCAFGIILARLVHWGMKCSISTGLSYLGQMTVPIMFMHIPLNKILSNISGNMMKNDRIVFCIIGIGGPVLITIVFSKYKTMRKLFGLPKI